MFSTDDSNGDVKVVGRDNGIRVTRYIPQRYLKLPDNFTSYKVLVPKTNGSGRLGESLSSPMVVGPSVAHTLTFLSIGNFEMKDEAEAALKYMKTRFARILLGTLKVTQDNPRPVWENIPLQDFTAESDIDWSNDISEIDQQLFEKYGLSEEEIDFILMTADEME